MKAYNIALPTPFNGMIRTIFVTLFTVSSMGLIGLSAHGNENGNMTSSMPLRPFAQSSLGIVGDSFAAAALTNPKLFLDYQQLIGVASSALYLGQTTAQIKYFQDPEYFKIKEPIASMVRIFPMSDPEQKDTNPFVRWLQERMLKAFEVEEYGYGYLVGSYFGVPAKNIITAAESGTKVEDMFRQFKRLARARPNLPDRILVSFNANDMCSQEVIDTEPSQFARAYYDRLMDEFKKILAPNALPVGEGGTTIYILASLDVMQLLTKPEILWKLVDYRGRGAFCHEIRKQKVYGGVKAISRPGKVCHSSQCQTKFVIEESSHGVVDTRTLEELLPNGCRGIFQVQPGDSKGLDHLQRVFNALLDAQAHAIHDAQKLAEGTNIRIRYLTDTAAIQFDNSNISNDCFHPSISGHAKVARKVIEDITVMENLQR